MADRFLLDTKYSFLLSSFMNCIKQDRSHHVSTNIAFPDSQYIQKIHFNVLDNIQETFVPQPISFSHAILVALLGVVVVATVGLGAAACDTGAIATVAVGLIACATFGTMLAAFAAIAAVLVDNTC
mmetsp:Transcript_24490/g.67660  ORF Transcript_24490/g.67660 Transcript_24490/m.67660 type:complete len:126 (-) Transcript_24490:309-686(-)